MKRCRRAEGHTTQGPLSRHASLALLLIALTLAGSACSSIRPVQGLLGGPRYRQSSLHQKVLNPSTTMDNGSWLGGDVAASIPVTEELRVWIFGDTLLGTFETECPKPFTYCDRKLAKGESAGPVHNSVGILRGRPGDYDAIERFWGKKENGNPASFFLSDKPDHYLWPLSGIHVEEGLILLANENSYSSGLSPVGGVLIHVRNPQDPPPQWEVRQKELPFHASTPKDKRAMSVTSSIVRRGDFLIAIGSGRNADGAPRSILGRVPVSALRNFDTVWPWEWWMKTSGESSAWGAPLDIAKLSPLKGLPGSSEATFDLSPEQVWETYQIPAFSYDIHRFTAESLEGPWKDRGAVYHVPIPWSRPAKLHCKRALLRSARTRNVLAVRRSIAKDPLCKTGTFVAYAPKSHPGFLPNGDQTLTYNVNLFFGKLRALVAAVEQYPGFYVPRVITKSGSKRSTP